MPTPTMARTTACIQKEEVSAATVDRTMAMISADRIRSVLIALLTFSCSNWAASCPMASTPSVPWCPPWGRRASHTFSAPS